MPSRLLEVGRLGKAHGLRGEVIAVLTSTRSERLAVGSVLTVGDHPMVVASSRAHQDRFIVRFEGVTDRNGAEELRGKVLWAEPIEDPDELWVHDLIGCEVADAAAIDPESGAPTIRGEVVAVEPNPASDLLVTDQGHLIPLRFVTEYEPGQRVVVDGPEGLFGL